MNANVCCRKSPSGPQHSRKLTPLRAAASGWILAGLLGACNALDEPGPKDSVVVIPTDTRAALLAAEPPAPITGGTLAVSSDGSFAVAADPDRDRVSVVELQTGDVHSIELNRGDRPGRVVLDDTGRAYVALRRSGDLVVIDVAGRSLEQRLHVCAAPRGVAFDAQAREVHVACSEGRLVSLQQQAAEPGAPAAVAVVRDLQVGADLRDVLIRGDQVWVSTFKRAELLRVDADGAILQRAAAQPFLHEGGSPRFPGLPSPTSVSMQPHLAYRSLLDASGRMIMLHQGASTAEVEIDHSPEMSAAASPYGSLSGGCSGIVGPAVTMVDVGGHVRTFPVTTGLLSIDMALSADGDTLAVVQAGARDTGAPARRTFFDSDAPTATTLPATSIVPGGFASSEDAGGVVTQLTLLDANGTDTACRSGVAVMVPGQATAVTFRGARATFASTAEPDSGPGWVVQSREPALLTLVPAEGIRGSQEARVIRLGGASVRDTGHDLFHQDAGGGVACASCHPEGAEDGHVWHFNTLGARRTQALHVGLEGTAPFHWSGDQADIDHLMADVFVGRMGGVYQSDQRLGALTRFLFAMQPPAAPVAEDGAAVERGRVLFTSAEAGCSSCHNGEKLTNNQSVDVGTGETLQVPSLRGIAYRAPFMHNGCAQTLRERFDVRCGGAAHGNTRDLSPQAVDDLVAYLRTL